MNDAARRTVLQQFPSGLYALTVKHQAEEHGTTVTWVGPASVDPPMVVVAVDNRSKTIGLIRDSHHFALNVLGEGQRDLVEKLDRAATSAQQTLKGIRTKPAPAAAAPILSDALGWLECRVVATLPAGDHTLVLGEVVEAGTGD